MEWLIVIAQMCQVTAGSGDGEWYVKVQKDCHRQLLECVGDLSEHHRNSWGASKKMYDCVLKRAKGELK